MAWYYSTGSYAPSSSAGSSPATGPADSSPNLSPSIEPLELDEGPSIIHPFAGSFRSKRIKISFVGTEEPSACGKTRRPSLHGIGAPSEQDIWSHESTRAYEEGLRLFNLSDKNLTYIDVLFIRDLKNMVVFPNAGPAAARSASTETKLRLCEPKAPAIAAQQARRTFSRNDSKNSARIPGEKDENVHLYLARNQITEIPNELWTLHNLTTLSLRGNRITYIPPEIGNLKNLRDLNVSVNELRFLPSELNNLALVHLNVHPNPLFLEAPLEYSRPVSKPEYMMDSQLPSLVELAFRVLVSPPTANMKTKFEHEGPWRSPPQNVLEYYMPLSPTFLDFVLARPLLQTLAACFPECVPKDMVKAPVGKDMELTGVGRCANPNHTAWFVHHAEQRFTWEKTVAGVTVGGAVPLRWRGCSRGCLGFLDEVVEETILDEAAIFNPVPLHDAPLGFDGDD